MRIYAPTGPSPESSRRPAPKSPPTAVCQDAASLAGEVLRLQQVVGNRRVGELLHDRAGRYGNRFEQEADRIADEVVGAPELAAHRGQRGATPAGVDEAGGAPDRPLDASTRAFFEPHLGSDLSRVRVHTDDRAAESAEAVGAQAYTVGSSILFGRGRYAPHTDTGRRLLAHELAHVVQQGGIGLSRAPVGLLQRQAAPAKVRKASPAPAPAKKTDAEIRRTTAESLVEVGGTAVAADTKAVVVELVKLPLRCEGLYRLDIDQAIGKESYGFDLCR